MQDLPKNKDVESRDDAKIALSPPMTHGPRYDAANSHTLHCHDQGSLSPPNQIQLGTSRIC